MTTSRLQDRRVWIGGGAVAVLLLAAASWLLLIHPRLADADSLRTQTADTNLQNSQLVTSNATLARKYAHLADLRKTLTKEIDAIPSANSFPDFTRQVNATATDTGVRVKTLTFGAPTAVAAPAAAAPTTSAATNATAGLSATSPTSETSSAATASAASQYQVSVSVTVDGTTARDVDFLDALQHGSRNVLITSTQFTAGKGTQLTVQAYVFTAPMTTEQLAQTNRLLSTAK